MPAVLVWFSGFTPALLVETEPSGGPPGVPFGLSVAGRPPFEAERPLRPACYSSVTQPSLAFLTVLMYL